MRVISIQKLVDDGYYEWVDSDVDSEGRTFLRRTERGNRAAATWGRAKWDAINRLFAAASVKPLDEGTEPGE